MTTTSTVTIRELRARAVRVPMPDPHRTASGTITESPLVLVDVVTSDGVIGHGIVFTYATGPYPQWHSYAWAAALVLILVVFVLSLGARLAISRRFTLNG